MNIEEIKKQLSEAQEALEHHEKQWSGNTLAQARTIEILKQISPQYAAKRMLYCQK